MHNRIQKRNQGGVFEYGNTAARTTLMLIAGNLMLIASAKIEVPFWPVPLTLETLAILIIAATYGQRLATATMALFLVEGAVGLPVFAGGGGLPYFLGPTGGYLIGFLLATMLVAYLMDRIRKQSFIRTMAAMLLGDIVVFAVGFAWLAVLIGYHDAFSKGVLPFIPGDLLKIALAASTVMIGRQIMRSRGSGKN